MNDDGQEVARYESAFEQLTDAERDEWRRSRFDDE